MEKMRVEQLAIPPMMMLALTGCGREDSLFSGFSLVVVIVLGLLIARHFAKKG